MLLFPVFEYHLNVNHCYQERLEFTFFSPLTPNGVVFFITVKLFLIKFCIDLTKLVLPR